MNKNDSAFYEAAMTAIEGGPIVRLCGACGKVISKGNYCGGCLEKHEDIRVCANENCGKDISERHKNAIYCVECSQIKVRESKRKYKRRIHDERKGKTAKKRKTRKRV